MSTQGIVSGEKIGMTATISSLKNANNDQTLNLFVSIIRIKGLKRSLTIKRYYLYFFMDDIIS